MFLLDEIASRGTVWRVKRIVPVSLKAITRFSAKKLSRRRRNAPTRNSARAVSFRLLLENARLLQKRMQIALNENSTLSDEVRMKMHFPFG